MSKFRALLVLPVAAWSFTVPPAADADHNTCGAAHSYTGANVDLISSSDTRDFWRITSLTGSRDIVVALQSLNGNADLYVWNAACGSVLCSSTNGANLPDTCIAGSTNGTVYAEVRWVSGDPVAYVLTDESALSLPGA